MRLAPVCSCLAFYPTRFRPGRQGTQVSRGLCAQGASWGPSSSELQELPLLRSGLAVLGLALGPGLWGKLWHAARAWGQYAWGLASTILPGFLSAAE